MLVLILIAADFAYRLTCTGLSITFRPEAVAAL